MIEDRLQAGQRNVCYDIANKHTTDIQHFIINSFD